MITPKLKRELDSWLNKIVEYSKDRAIIRTKLSIDEYGLRLDMKVISSPTTTTNFFSRFLMTNRDVKRALKMLKGDNIKN